VSGVSSARRVRHNGHSAFFIIDVGHLHQHVGGVMGDGLTTHRPESSTNRSVPFRHVEGERVAVEILEHRGEQRPRLLEHSAGHSGAARLDRVAAQFVDSALGELGV
jgi:hypothetical protein